MDALLITLLLLAILLLAFMVLLKPRKRIEVLQPLPANYRQLLDEHVSFYQKLDAAGKEAFANRVQQFLATVRITGAGTIVEDIDRVLIGASAIIPIYAFPGWEYVNIREVLLYPGTFNEQFELQGKDRSVLGMVGEGVLQQTMILSQPALREGFSNATGKSNPAIHEFIHLIDKTDGAVDGVPEVLLSQQYTLPWLDMMQKNIQAIRHNRSDINPYGASNQAEFLAVAAEYFFERPELLQSKHPELYKMLEEMFSPSAKQ